jgi:hypothetical protein
MILEFYNTFGWISKPLPFRKRKTDHGLFPEILRREKSK